jgi:UDPglucose 6-dehydrogenase
LSPGAAFAGGTLARDVVFLAELGKAHKVPAELLTAVKSSNDRHRTWAQNKIDQAVKNLSGATVAVWGLTYKPGTDTLRGSSAIELCYWLADRGARVHAHDPVVEKSSLPEDLAERITLVHTSLAAVDGAAALVVCTPWPEYRNVPAADVVPRMARPLVLDAARFTAGTLGADKAITYVSVGRTSA